MIEEPASHNEEGGTSEITAEDVKSVSIEFSANFAESLLSFCKHNRIVTSDENDFVDATMYAAVYKKIDIDKVRALYTILEQELELMNRNMINRFPMITQKIAFEHPSLQYLAEKIKRLEVFDLGVRAAKAL